MWSDHFQEHVIKIAEQATPLLLVALEAFDMAIATWKEDCSTENDEAKKDCQIETQGPAGTATLGMGSAHERSRHMGQRCSNRDAGRDLHRINAEKVDRTRAFKVHQGHLEERCSMGPRL